MTVNEGIRRAKKTIGTPYPYRETRDYSPDIRIVPFVCTRPASRRGSASERGQARFVDMFSISRRDDATRKKSMG